MASHSSTSKRDLVEPRPGDKRFVRRDSKGRFAESDDVGRSLASDIKQAARNKVKSGQGDRGDQAERSSDRSDRSDSSGDRSATRSDR
jgi:hypothetical protein